MPSFEKSKSSGLWSVRFRENVNGEVKNMRLSGFKTKKDAQYGYEDYVVKKEKEEAEAKLNAPAPLTALDMSFSELIELFYIYKRPRVKDTSFYDTEKKIESRLRPFFGHLAIKDITPSLILEWYSTLKEYSYQYKKGLIALLSGVFNYAKKYHDVPNVMDKVDRPRDLDPKKEMLIYTPEEFAKCYQATTKRDYQMLFAFLYLSGCRRGEALALGWDDIDLATGRVAIKKSIAYKVHDNGKPYQITTPKNVGSNRTIFLPKFFCNAMQEYKEWQKQTLPDGASTSFVFGGTDPLPPTSISRTLTAAAEKAGVKRIRVHDLRHSCASLLIHSGVTIVAVSRRLGHTNIEQTLNTY